MSKKIVCCVPSLWDLPEYRRHRCDDASHKHLSRAQVNQYESQGRVRWLRRPDREGLGGVLKLTAPPLGRPIDRVMIRDMSCRVGEVLTVAVADNQAWARVMLANIAMRPRNTQPVSVA